MALELNVTIPDGWQTAWLDRTSPAFSWLRIITSLAQCVYVVHITLAGREYSRVASLLNHHTGSHGREGLNTAKAVMKRLNAHKRMASWLSLLLWHAQLIVIFAIDAGICTMALNEDASLSPHIWNFETAVEVLSFTTFYLGTSALSFLITPAIAIAATMFGASENESDGRTGLEGYLDSSMKFFVETANDFLPFYIPQVLFSWPVRKNPRWRIAFFALVYGYGVVVQYMKLACTFRANRLRELRLRERSWKGCLELFYATLNVVDFGPQSEEDRQMKSLGHLEASKPRME